MKVLTVIPARKGSKRFPNKNKLLLNGKSLCQWSINAAKEITFENKICLSTDDDELLKQFNNNDIDILKRPLHLATDTASLQDLCNDLLQSYYKKGYIFNYVILLQPTSPLREKDLLQNCLNKVIQNKANGLIELEPIKISTGLIKNGMWHPDYKIGTQSQNIDTKFKPSGRVFIYKVDNNNIKKCDLIAQEIGDGTKNNIDLITDLDIVKGCLLRDPERYKHLY